MAQKNISRVSEEMEGRVTKKVLKGFSRTESRILGALSKFDEFLLYPQVPTFCVAIPRKSKNGDSENPEHTGGSFPKELCPQAMFFSHHSGNQNGSEL